MREREFIKCEVSFQFNDGDQLTGARKIVQNKNLGDFVDRQINKYRKIYGESLNYAEVKLFSWHYVKHSLCRLLGVCKDTQIKSYDIKI